MFSPRTKKVAAHLIFGQQVQNERGQGAVGSVIDRQRQDLLVGLGIEKHFGIAAGELTQQETGLKPEQGANHQRHQQEHPSDRKGDPRA